MASCKIWSRESDLMGALLYDIDPSKTLNPDYHNELLKAELSGESRLFNKEFLVSVVNSDPDDVYGTMKRLLEGNSGNRPIVNVAYRAEQSFKKGEVTPRIAHEIGVKLAERLWGDNFVVQVSTHNNTGIVHNHFTICSVGLDGKRFDNNGKTKWLMREASDKLCEEYGLSIITPDPKKYRYKNYGEWKAAKEGGNLNTHRGQLKHDIDKVIDCSITEKEFFYNMKKLGYTITSRGKYYTVYADDFQRPIRLSPKLGKGYSIEDIIQRIHEGNRQAKPMFQPYVKCRAIRYRGSHLPVKSFPSAIRGYVALYYRYCYMLGVFPKREKNHPTRWIPPKLREDINKLQMVSDELNILVPNHITNSEELQQYKATLQKKESVLLSQRDELRKAQKRRTISPAEAEQFKSQITDLTKTIKGIRYRIRLCDDIAANSSRRSEKMSEELNHEFSITKEAQRAKYQNIKKERL